MVKGYKIEYQSNDHDIKTETLTKKILHHKIYGEGEPLIVLHGLFGMLDNWQTFARQLSDSFQVITVDLRNHGRSFHDEDSSYQAMAEDIKVLLNELGLDLAHFLGHSMGGKAICQFALNHPDKVNSLIVVDILPISYQRGHDQVLAALNAMKPHEAESRKEATDRLIQLLDGDESTAYFLLKSLKRLEGGGFEWRFNLPVLTAKYDEIRGSVQGEPYESTALFIKGANSDYITVDGWIEATEFFPQAELEEIDEAGHWVHADQLETLVGVVKRFLTEQQV